MNNKLFDSLTRDNQFAYLLGTASQMFGRTTVLQLARQMKPIIEDSVAHGTFRIPGESKSTDTDFWNGHWKVYDAQ